MLSDRDSDADLAPIPSLLLLERRAPPPAAPAHPHPGLARRRGRRRARGAPRRAAHRLRRGGGQPVPGDGDRRGARRATATLAGVDPEKAVANLIKALGKGVLKVMSKMGISTIASYRGAQVFEAIGLSTRRWSTATSPARTSRLGGVGLDVIAAEVAARHADAYPASGNRQAHRRLARRRRVPVAPRRRGAPVRPGDRVPAAALDPRRASSTSSGSTRDRVDDQSPRLMTLRGLLDVQGRASARRCRSTRSSRSARSSSGSPRARCRYGSISAEAHETLAIAMNRLGGKSNTGEGGEDPERLHDPARRSAIKQIASGRFGVTQRVPDQRRRHPDQDGPGRQARRGRPAARPQGLPVDRRDAALDARRRAHLAAAAPRHLLDRGPRAAHPRRSRTRTRGARSTSSSSASSASARSRRASPRRTPTSCSSRGTTAARARAR